MPNSQKAGITLLVKQSSLTYIPLNPVFWGVDWRPVGGPFYSQVFNSAYQDGASSVLISLMYYYP